MGYVHDNYIENLIYLFSKLPGLGPRSARRIVLHLLEDKKHRMTLLASSLSNTEHHVQECIQCFNIDNTNPCSICSDEGREKIIAVVENIADLWALERSGSYSGLYHILGSGLKPSNEKKYDDFRLDKLMSRIRDISVNELIIATSTTLEGQTTAFYITEFFKKHTGIIITRIASGVPIGGELDYLDEGTLSAALRARSPF